MPRAERVDAKDCYYHVLNRANARLTLFEQSKEYRLFESVLEEAKEKYSMRVIAYCCMPNHFHFIHQPQEDGDLSKFMYWFFYDAYLALARYSENNWVRTYISR